MKIKIPELKRELTEVKKEKAEGKSISGDDKSSAVTKKLQAVRNRPGYSNIPTFIDFKWMLSAYATIAAFYNAVGNQVKCEKVYVIYVKWIEAFYGS